MSPWFLCAGCEQAVIGNGRYGCMLCKKANIAAAVRRRSYFAYVDGLLGCPLPAELVQKIARHAVGRRREERLFRLSHELAWRELNHWRRQHLVGFRPPFGDRFVRQYVTMVEPTLLQHVSL